MQTLLIIDDDPAISFGLAAALEREERRIIVCRDIESAELVVESQPVTDIVSDIKLTGEFRFEGLDFVSHAKQFAPAARVILMSGSQLAGLGDEARQRGAVTLLAKPFEVGEIEALLTEISPDGQPAETIVMPTLDEISSSDQLTSAFQPIIELRGGYTRGNEALSRFVGNPLLANPEVLFAYADRKQRVIDLEIACIRGAIRRFTKSGMAGLLFANVHPYALRESDRLYMAIAEQAEESGLALDRLVLEFTEQKPMRDDPAVFETIAALRSRGVRFALDDLGVAYSHLPLIERIRPSFIKISQTFGTAFEEDATRRKIVANLMSLAREFSCEVILEGIETAQTADAAVRLGIDLGQGFLFGRPRFI